LSNRALIEVIFTIYGICITPEQSLSKVGKVGVGDRELVRATLG